MMEDVNNYPEKYYGKFMYFDKAKISGDVERKKEIGAFTVGVKSARGKYFTGVILSHLFFSTSDTIGNELLTLLKDNEEFIRVKIYCEIQKHKEAFGDKAIPRAHIFKIEVFNSGGQLSMTLED
jgi:hypothetical protein